MKNLQTAPQPEGGRVVHLFLCSRTTHLAIPRYSMPYAVCTLKFFFQNPNVSGRFFLHKDCDLPQRTTLLLTFSHAHRWPPSLETPKHLATKAVTQAVPPKARSI